MRIITFPVPLPDWVAHLRTYARIDTSGIVRVFASAFTPDVTFRVDDDAFEMHFEGDCTWIKRSQICGIRINRAEKVMGVDTFCTLRVGLEDLAGQRFSYPLITCPKDEVAVFKRIASQVKPVLSELGWDELSG